MNKYFVLLTITFIVVMLIFILQSIGYLKTNDDNNIDNDDDDNDDDDDDDDDNIDNDEKDKNYTTDEPDEYAKQLCVLGFWGHLPHPKYCHKFIMCVGGQALLRVCSPGFEFNGVNACKPISPDSTCDN